MRKYNFFWFFSKGSETARFCKRRDEKQWQFFYLTFQPMEIELWLIVKDRKEQLLNVPDMILVFFQTLLQAHQPATPE